MKKQALKDKDETPYRPDKVENRGRFYEVMGYPDYQFEAKIFPVGSQDGIGGGRISKLHVYNLGEEVMSYQRGWDAPDLKPKTREEKKVLKTILQGFPEMNLKMRAMVALEDAGNDARRIVNRTKNAVSHLASPPTAKEVEEPNIPNNPMGFFKTTPSVPRHERLDGAARKDGITGAEKPFGKQNNGAERE